MKIVLANYIRETVNYLPQNSLSLNRLFVNLANKNEKICLTLECRGINLNGPSKFCTEADNPEKQTRYINIEKNDRLFNVFPRKRIQNSELQAGFSFSD